MATILNGADEAAAAAGRDLGVTDWMPVPPDAAARFAGAVGGRQPVPSGELPEYLVLSLSNLLLPLLLEVREVALGVNYGTGEVRFPARAPAGSRLRARGTIVAAEAIAGGAQTTTRLVVEAEGVELPVCVVDALSRWMAG